jgi:hypothetical protein
MHQFAFDAFLRAEKDPRRCPSRGDGHKEDTDRKY